MNANLKKFNNQRHPYHLVDPSPWPLCASLGAFGLTFGGVMYMHNYSGFLLNDYWFFNSLIVCIFGGVILFVKRLLRSAMQRQFRWITHGYAIIYCIRSNVLFRILLGFF